MSGLSFARSPSDAATLVLDEPLGPGRRLGQYVVRTRLGQGGMGVVYRALDLETGRDVALKTLYERNPAALYRLKREFRSLADVSHRNLVALGELAVADGRPFFTMELVEGVDFRRWLELGPPRTDPAYFVRLRYGLRQIVAGLRALHGAGKVHCDLKPSNVLVTRDDRVVVVDFGLVRERPVVAGDVSGPIWGTAMYMAPEQARTPEVGPPADWYSLGVLLYAALTGRFPFRGNAMQILLAKQETESPPPSTVAAGVPRDLDALCAALLHTDPAARPGSADILARLGVPDHEAATAIPRDTSTLPLRSVFIGRRGELELLRDSLEHSRREHRAVLLRGPSGVGKTSLARHFLERARAQYDDAILLVGRCYQRDSMPYRAIDSVIDSLSDYLRRLDQVELAHLLPEQAALLGRVFPVLARVPAIASAPAAAAYLADPAELRAHVFLALRQLLSTLADRAPVVVFIDDLQWADDDGLALLGDLFHPPDAPRAMLLATVSGDAGELRRRLARWSHQQRAVVDLELEPLPPPEAEALAGILLERMAPTLVTNAGAIAGEASGVPLLIDEIVRRQARSSATSSVNDAIWERLGNLSLRERVLMAALAVAGTPLDLYTASLATQTTVDRTRQLMRSLESERLVRARSTADGRQVLEPYHDRIREVLVGRLSDDKRVAWHRRLANALLSSTSTDQTPFNALRHLTLAREPQRAARLAVQAAQRAAASMAFEAAANFYRLAIEHGDHGAGAVLELQRELAETLVNAGRGAEAATVLEQLAAAVHDPQARADYLRRAAEQLLFAGDLDRGRALLGSVASEFGVRVPATELGAATAIAWRRLQLWVRGTDWQPRPVEQVPARAILAQDVHHSVGTILATVDPLRGMALTAKASLMALRLGVPDRAIRALSTEAICRAGTGDHQRAAALLQQASAEAQAADDRSLLVWLDGARAITAYMTGNFAEVIAVADQALVRFSSVPCDQRARLSTGGAFEIAVLRYYRMTALAHLGRCNQLRRAFHDALHDARRRGDKFAEANTAYQFNLVWLLDDDPDEARAQLAAQEWAPPGQTFHTQHLLMLRAAVQIQLYSGTGATARGELGDQLERSKRSLLLRVPPLRAEYEFLLGRLALAEAEAERGAARSRHRQAVAAAGRLERLGLPQARVAAALLRAAVAHQRGDHQGAVAELLQAEATAGHHRLSLLETAARRRRGQLVGGTAGIELIEEADRWATEQEIRAPAKIARMLAPGFDE